MIIYDGTDILVSGAFLKCFSVVEHKGTVPVMLHLVIVIQC